LPACQGRSAEEKGVLKVRLAKKAKAKPKLIKVNVQKTLEAKSPSKVA
jgi:hypothetical protein